MATFLHQILLFIVTVTTITPVLCQNSTNVDEPWTPCFPGSFWQRRLSNDDCAHAINKIPQIPTQHTFHSHGDNDDYLLPRTETSGSCMFMVSIKENFDDEVASWERVHNAGQWLRM